MYNPEFLKGRTILTGITLFLLLFLLPAASAIDITLTHPLNKSYPYSTNLPLWSSPSADATSCYYTTDNGLTNNTFNCNTGRTRFDVDFDGSYQLVAYAENATAVASDSVVLNIYRGFTTSMGVVAAGIILAIASLIFFTGYISKNIGDKFKGLNYFFFGMSFLFIIVTLNVAYTISREYLKVPSFADLLMNLYFIIFWVGFALLAYFLFHVFLYKKLIKNMENIDDVKL